MRRQRNRYYTIDAENEEEYIKELDNIQKSRLSKLAFENKENEDKIQEIDEEDNLSQKKSKKILYFR